MNPIELNINWSYRAKLDIRNIYHQLIIKNSVDTSKKIMAEIISAPAAIIFPEQFQLNEYAIGCRRIIIRNYKILYTVHNTTINIVAVISTYANPRLLML